MKMAGHSNPLSCPTKGCRRVSATSRSVLGSAKMTCSSRPLSSSATSPPHSRSLAMTPWTRISGAEAPAVTPMVLAPSNHSRRKCCGPSTR